MGRGLNGKEAVDRRQLRAAPVPRADRVRHADDNTVALAAFGVRAAVEHLDTLAGGRVDAAGPRGLRPCDVEIRAQRARDHRDFRADDGGKAFKLELARLDGGFAHAQHVAELLLVFAPAKIAEEDRERQQREQGQRDEAALDRAGIALCGL